MSDDRIDISVLYVEDDITNQLAVADLLNKKVKNLYLAENGKEGLFIYKQYEPDLIITDIRMPFVDGLEMSRAIKNIDMNAQIILTSEHADPLYFLHAINIGVSNYVLKPVKKEMLYGAIDKCYKFITYKRQAKNQIDYFIRSLDRFRDELDKLQDEILDPNYKKSNNIEKEKLIKDVFYTIGKILIR